MTNPSTSPPRSAPSTPGALSGPVATPTTVGIGAVGTGSSAQILDGLGLTDAERAAFLAEGPVGDSCCRFFDARGRPIGGVVDERVLAIELEQLRAIPTVVGVATGPDKAPGVLGALRGGLVDGLVTDAGLALALLSGPADR